MLWLPPSLSPALLSDQGGKVPPLQERCPLTVVEPGELKLVLKGLPWSRAAARVIGLNVEPAWKPVLPPRSDPVVKLMEIGRASWRERERKIASSRGVVVR